MTKIVLKLNCGDSNPPFLAEKFIPMLRSLAQASHGIAFRRFMFIN